MSLELSPEAIRVLGCLIEKEMATPEYYPLTMNALVNACNQKSNREPVMSLNDDDVIEGLEELRREQLSYKSSEGVRAVRYCHNVPGVLKLAEEEQALLTLLLLRGPQTLGELRTRSERLWAFTDLEAVESVLTDMQERDEPLVIQLERQAGRKEPRYAQLLSGDPIIEETAADASIVSGASRQDRISQLENEVAELKVQLASLREQFGQFRDQFE
jgi:uncharacterized protein